MAARIKSDFLRECLSDVGQMPLDVFSKRFCLVCSNSECIRSRAHQSPFTYRAENWKKDLFDSVPRAQEDDPNYSNIRSKKFLPLYDPNPPSIILNPVQDPQSNPAGLQWQEEQSETDSDIQASSIIQNVLETQPEPQKILVNTPRVVLPVQNTPFTQGLIIPGGPSKSAKQNDNVTEPGQSYSFGGDDEGGESE